VNVKVHELFDRATNTLTYIVWDPRTKDAVIIDPVLDYDPTTQITSHESINAIRHFVGAEQLVVHWILETHAHADHLSAARDLKTSGLGAAIGVSEKMMGVFNTFAKVFGWPKGLALRGVDRFFQDGEEFTAGSLRWQAIATPGHTSACTTFKIGEYLFTGDALFMPDSGVGRCDFPGGSAATLYDSVWGKIYRFPESYAVFVGHDYQPGGRPVRFRSTVGEQKSANIHLKETTSKADFVKFREARDKTLSAPRLLNPSLDWNLGAHQIVRPL
jgi:glyoxylase-like metal-dependent hydrolase (beta-lactamase superfamily II)